MDRRVFLKRLGIVVSSASVWPPVEALAACPNPFRLTFGSCALQENIQPIWKRIAEKSPDLFVGLGDNIYADTLNPLEMASKYATLGRISDYRLFREQFPTVATWDDHDYGANDAGREYPMKEESKRLFLDFFAEPWNTDRRKRDGVYTSYLFGSWPNRIQIILLDLRWFRDTLTIGPNGFYIPSEDPQATLLGNEQWSWLETELEKDANVRIIGSSIQFASSEHGWEKWANFPREKQRLLKLVDEFDLQNVFVISGDMHFGELSSESTAEGRVIYDLTSSGLNLFESSKGIPNSKRLAVFDQSSNFGMLTIEWEKRRVIMEIFDDRGIAMISHSTELDPQVDPFKAPQRKIV